MTTQATASNETAPDDIQCDTFVEISELFIYLAGPSIVLLLILSFFERRNRPCHGCVGNHFGLLPPMNFLSGGSRRLSYAAANGILAQVFITFFREGLPFGGNNSGQLSLPFFAGLIKAVMALLFGLGAYPIFSALYSKSAGASLLGTVYVWTILSVNIYNFASCLVGRDISEIEGVFGMSLFNRYTYFLYFLPLFASMAYLSVSLPWRFVKAVRTWLTIRKLASMPEEPLIKPNSAAMRYVKRLLIGKANLPEEKTRFMRILHMIYEPTPDFRFSPLIVSTFTVAFILGYMAVVSGFSAVSILYDFFGAYVAYLKNDTISKLFNIGVGVVYTSISLGSIVTLLMMSRTLVNFKKDLLALYRGSNSRIPPISSLSNSSVLKACMSYSGFQIAFIVLGLIVHTLVIFIILSLVTFVLAVPIIMFDYTDILTQLAIWGTGPLFGILLYLLQILWARFAFLQQKNSLAVDNRKMFFIIIYFMSFYNTITGILQSLKRVFLSFFLASIFMSRMDRSVMLAGFESMDPGFVAYVGFLHVTHAHTNPTMRVFCSLLLEASKKHRLEDTAPQPAGTLSNVLKDSEDLEQSLQKTNRTRSQMIVRNRYHLWLLLSRNPHLSSSRGHICNGSFQGASTIELQQIDSA